jgi:endogenous inhibitor of DNA gyrase (YacG/DUF329 family)
LIDLGAWATERYRVPGESASGHDADDDSDEGGGG